MQSLFETQRLEAIAKAPENQRMPQKILGGFIDEGDLHVLAGITNSGKSILANDIAIMVAGGKSFWEEPMCEVQGKSLIVDFELSDYQTAIRYREGADMVPKEVIRAKLSSLGYSSGREALLDEVQGLIEVYAPKLLVLDNLTALLGSSTAVSEVFEVMSRLKLLKEAYKMTVVVVTHLRKQNSKKRKPLTMDDIYGSSAITRFADSVTILGEDPNEESRKYLKLLKTRSGACFKEVAVLNIESSPYLHFEFEDWSSESYFLPVRENCMKGAITPELREQMIQLHNEGLSFRQIAEETGCGKSSVGRFFKALEQ